MGRGKVLTETEKGQIKAYEDAGLSIAKIAKKIERSRHVISNFLSNQCKYGKNMKGRTHSVVTNADRRLILRKASNSHDSLAKIKEKCGVKASLTTMRRVISKAKHLKRLKIKKKPPLNPVRKVQRLSFCRAHVTWTSEWHRVVFSDEKKFNLEGPDGYSYYFHDLRKETHYLDRLHSRVGGVMVWGAISYYGTCELQFMSTTMNALSYNGVLEKAFPFFHTLFGPLPWIYQHDNAPIHTARVVKTYIQSQNVELLSWPPYSPDLNIIENVWGWLTRQIYGSGQQYSSVPELIQAIKLAWSSISLDYLANLYTSLPNQMCEVLEQKGGSTHY